MVSSPGAQPSTGTAGAHPEAAAATGECFTCAETVDLTPGNCCRCPQCYLAVYCSGECQKAHWMKGHHLECKKAKALRLKTVPKMSYPDYLEWYTKKCCYPAEKSNNSGFQLDPLYAILFGKGLQGGNMDRWRKDKVICDLSEKIGYTVSKEENPVFRLQDFLYNVVGAGEDTEENMNLLFGPQEAQEDNAQADNAASSDNVDKTSVIDYRTAVKPFWLEARLAVACGVGVPKDSHAYLRGARPGEEIPEGQGASELTLNGLKKLAGTFEEMKQIVEATGREISEDCGICMEVFQKEGDATDAEMGKKDSDDKMKATGATGDDNAPNSDTDSEDNRVQILPSCSHCFHVGCLANWLQRNANCPMCRVRLPDRIPRPATLRETRLAARLKKETDRLDNAAGTDGSPKRRKIDPTNGGAEDPGQDGVRLESTGGPFKGTYEPTVELLYRLTDKHKFGSGDVKIACSPSGKELAVSSTSFCGIISISTSDKTCLGETKFDEETPYNLRFPHGPGPLAFDSSDPNERRLYCVFSELNAAGRPCHKFRLFERNEGHTNQAPAPEIVEEFSTFAELTDFPAFPALAPARYQEVRTENQAGNQEIKGQFSHQMTVDAEGRALVDATSPENDGTQMAWISVAKRNQPGEYCEEVSVEGVEWPSLLAKDWDDFERVEGLIEELGLRKNRGKQDTNLGKLGKPERLSTTSVSTVGKLAEEIEGLEIKSQVKAEEVEGLEIKSSEKEKERLSVSTVGGLAEKIEDLEIQSGKSEAAAGDNGENEHSKGDSDEDSDSEEMENEGFGLLSDYNQGIALPCGSIFFPPLDEDAGLPSDNYGILRPTKITGQGPDGYMEKLQVKQTPGPEEALRAYRLRGDLPASSTQLPGLPSLPSAYELGISPQFAASPNGDIVCVFKPEGERFPSVMWMEKPESIGGEAETSTVKITKLKGFRKCEEIHGVCVDKENNVYIIVCLQWPQDREVYVVRPKK